LSYGRAAAAESIVCLAGKPLSWNPPNPDKKGNCKKRLRRFAWAFILEP